MDFRFSDEEEAFRQEVREFLRQEVSPELIRELEGWRWVRVPDVGPRPLARDFARKLGEKRWLGIGWPEKYGGSPGSFMKDYILEEELACHRVRIPNRTAVRMIGPMILKFGTEEQKSTYLPRIAQGETEFALGYTEPEAGSDLASLQMRAVEDGDYYMISGQKVFNTSAHLADYHWLAARTDRTVARHKGISLFIVDLKSPGITVRPLWTMAGGRTNEVFYDSVRVPRQNMVGEKNKGWHYMTAALDRERITILSTAELWATFQELLNHVKKQAGTNRAPVAKNLLAQVCIELQVAELLARHVAWMIDRGMTVDYQGAITKVFITELAQKLVNAGMRLTGLYGQLRKESAHAVWGGELEQGYRASVMPTFGGGTSEILRTMVATKGLGLPAG